MTRYDRIAAAMTAPYLKKMVTFLIKVLVNFLRVKVRTYVAGTTKIYAFKFL